MGPEHSSAGGQAPSLGYDRHAVDDFLRAAAEERDKLQQQIEASNLRLARARTALGTHRVMVTMLLEAQREVTALRRDAERQAAEIIAAAERDAREIEVRRGAVPSNGVQGTSAADGTPLPTGDDTAGPFSWAHEHDAAHGIAPSTYRTAPSAGDEEFFEFLRGALDDHEPLGPRPE